MFKCPVMEASLGPEDGKIGIPFDRTVCLQGLGEQGTGCSLPSLTGVIILVPLHREPTYSRPDSVSETPAHF